MCIRDRGDVPGSLYFMKMKINVAYNIPPSVWHHVILSEDCLLYTSDAADERSSVDLGGRRIIKKKNNIGTPE